MSKTTSKAATKAPEKKPVVRPPIIDTKEKMFEAIEQIAAKIIDQETSSPIKNEVPQILLSYSPDSNRGAENGAKYINSSLEKRALKSVEIFQKWFRDNSSNPAISQVSDKLLQIGIQPYTTDTNEFINAIKSNYQEKEAQGLDGAAAFLEEIKPAPSNTSGWKGDPLFVYNHFIKNSYKSAANDLSNYIQLNAESIPAGLIFYYWGCALQFSNKDNQDALKFYDFALKMHPFNQDPFFAKEIYKFKSACFFELKDYDGAVSSLEQYIKLAPEDNEMNLPMASLKIYANDFEGAINYADISIEKGLHTAESLAIKGLAHRNLGDFNQSAGNFSDAFSLNNSKGSFLRQKALSLKLLSETKEPADEKLSILNAALKCCREAIDMNEGVFDSSSDNGKLVDATIFDDESTQGTNIEELTIKAPNLIAEPILEDPHTLPAGNAVAEVLESSWLIIEASAITYSLNEELALGYALKACILFHLERQEEAIEACDHSLEIAKSINGFSLRPESQKIIEEMHKYKAESQSGDNDASASSDLEAFGNDQMPKGGADITSVAFTATDDPSQDLIFDSQKHGLDPLGES